MGARGEQFGFRVLSCGFLCNLKGADLPSGMTVVNSPSLLASSAGGSCSSMPPAARPPNPRDSAMARPKIAKTGDRKARAMLVGYSVTEGN